MPGRLTLPAQRRLRRKRDFDATYAHGWRLGDGFFSVTVKSNTISAPRLGLAAAVSVAGGGVARNRTSKARPGTCCTPGSRRCGRRSPHDARPRLTPDPHFPVDREPALGAA